MVSILNIPSKDKKISIYLLNVVIHFLFIFIFLTASDFIKKKKKKMTMILQSLSEPP